MKSCRMEPKEVKPFIIILRYACEIIEKLPCRHTPYWFCQPDIMTDAQGKAKVEFFNNSTCEEMYISVEGMTQNGKVLVNE